MTPLWLIVLAGALTGAGLVVVVAGLVPPRPDLFDGVQRALSDSSSSHPLSPAHGGPWVRVQSRTLPAAVRAFGLHRYAQDLRTVQLVPERLAARKLGYGLTGLAFPSVATALLALLGVTLPLAVPAAAGVGLGALFFWLPDLQLRQDATAERMRLRATAAVFLELVAMERLADAGPTEALDRAAAIGGSGQFARIRDALLRAELAGQPSWTGLTDLAATTGVTELSDTADIVALAGRDGAAVATTLRARAASVRTQLLTLATAKANAASEHMVVPVSLLGLCFVALLGYPALIRILQA